MTQSGSPQDDALRSEGRARLPNADQAHVDEAKITDYLLNFFHPDGASKAAFFASFGFGSDDWRVLAEALKAHARANLLDRAVESPFGTRYTAIGPLETPSGRRPCVATVWIVEPAGLAPRLITVYPAKRANHDSRA